MSRLDELEASGALEPLTSSQTELEKLLTSATRWLHDASIEAVSDQGRFVSAYDAILVCATLALRANDLRVAVKEGHHAITIESLAGTLKLDPIAIRRLQKLRQRRNLDLYEGDLPISASELESAIRAALDLLEQTKEYVRKLRPGFSKD